MFSRETGQYFILCFYFRGSGGQRPRVAYVVEIVRRVAIKNVFFESVLEVLCCVYLFIVPRQASNSFCTEHNLELARSF
jgi:hypothetical protein